MSLVTIDERLGTAAGANSKFYVYSWLYYDESEVIDQTAKVYHKLAIYGPSTKLATYGYCSWLSGNYQIGGTSDKYVYNGTTYYASAQLTDSGTWYAAGDTISVSGATCWYTSTSKVKHTSTLSAYSVTMPSLIPTYEVTYDANGGTGAPEAQTKTQGTDLVLSTTIPTLSDMVFRTWSGSDGNNYKPGATYTTDAALTLTAVWGAAKNCNPKIGGRYYNGVMFGKVEGHYRAGTPFGKISGHYKEGN